MAPRGTRLGVNKLVHFPRESGTIPSLSAPVASPATSFTRDNDAESLIEYF